MKKSIATKTIISAITLFSFIATAEVRAKSCNVLFSVEADQGISSFYKFEAVYKGIKPQSQSDEGAFTSPQGGVEITTPVDVTVGVTNVVRYFKNEKNSFAYQGSIVFKSCPSTTSIRLVKKDKRGIIVKSMFATIEIPSFYYESVAGESQYIGVEAKNQYRNYEVKAWIPSTKYPVK